MIGRKDPNSRHRVRRWMLLMAMAFVLLGHFRAEAIEEIYVYHLLVRTRAEAEKSLDAIVNAGGGRKNFITISREYSKDHPSKGSGGDLGWNSRRKFVREFADVAFDTEVGQVSEPVQTQYGWHLIFVKDKRDLRAAAQAEKNAAGQSKKAPAKKAASPTKHGEKKKPTVPTAIGTKDPGTAASKTTVEKVDPPAKPDTSAKSSVVLEKPPATPTAKPAVARPVKRPLPDQKLKLTISSASRSVRPTAELEISLVLSNQGKASAKIFAASLFPLGLGVRTDTTPRNPPATWDAVTDPESFVVDLGSRTVTGGTFALSDYFKDLPANCRLWVNWEGKRFRENFNKRFPDKASTVDDFPLAIKNFPTTRSSTFQTEVKGLPKHNRYYFRNELPVSIFDLRSTGRYFLRLEMQRQNSPLWFELFTREQYRGVRHFAALVNDGFYDRTRFFDIQKGDYIRGGCPKNNGTGVPETTQILDGSGSISHEKGILSLITRLGARGQGREAGSIFFIALKDHKEFDKVHVPVGRLVLGEDVLDKIAGEGSEFVNIDSINTASIVTAARAPQAVLEAADGGVATETPAGTPPATPTTSTAADTVQPTTAGDVPVKIVERPAVPRVLIETSKGGLTVELFQDDASNTVSNFVSLVEDGFYNPDAEAKKAPLQFFDRQAPYYIRTGSSDSSEVGGPGYTIRSEIAKNTRRHLKGTLSMCLDQNATDGKPIPDTGGSQFFICLDDVPFWNGLYTPFGKVIGGLDVLAKLQKGDTIVSVKVLQKRTGPYNPVTTKK